jgi:predicted MPP superfamily phosphohydrolase
MKKFLVIVLFILGALGIVLAIRAGLPKYSYMLPGFALLIILDLYLWFSVLNFIRKIHPAAGILISSLYWLPFAMIVACVIAGIFIPFETWNIPVRTYVTGIAAVIYVSKIFPILGLLAADAVRFIRYIAGNLVHYRQIHFNTFRRWKFFTYSGWISGVVFFLLLSWGMIFGIYDFQVKKVVITLPELPESFDGFKIAQVSDIHLGSWPDRSRLIKAIAMTDSLKPDVIFCTGDIANFYTGDVEGWKNILKELKAPYGVYAIMGNHDYGDYLLWSDSTAKAKNLADLQEFYKRLGWKLLLNEHGVLKRDSDSIAIIGVENWGSYKRFQRRADLEKAEKGIEDMQVQLLLSHDPSYWDQFIYNKHPNIDITFSGHTHGFQFGIETGKILWSPFHRMYREWAGLYLKEVEGNRLQYIYVNRGLGTIGFPGRVGILPEITLFILKKQK